MKCKIAVALATVFMMALPGVAFAGQQDPQDPCEHNPTTLCDGFELDQPTAEECPAGGIVIVVGDVRYPVCNGTNGHDGQDGQNGQDGTPGANGTDGTNGTNGVDGTNGTNGSDGANGTSGTNGTNGVNGANGIAGTNGTTVYVQPPKVVSKRHFRITLATKKLRHAKRVAMYVGGKKVIRHPDSRGRVWVDLRGLPRGSYAVVVRQGKQKDIRWYTVGLGNVSHVNVP